MNTEIAKDIAELVGDGPSNDLAMGGALEGIRQWDEQMSLWAPPIQSADSEILPEKGLNDARVNELMRKDGYVQAGAQLHKDNIVGHDFFPMLRPDLTILGLDEGWAKEFKEETEAKFYAWAESLRNWPDASASNTLTGLVRLAVGVFCAGGEVLATAEWLREAGRPFRTAVQMVDADRLSTPDEHMNDRRVRAGVRLNSRGAALGYYIRKAHQSDFDRGMDVMDHKYVAATKPWGRRQVIYIREQSRPDQTRGVSDIVAGLKTLKITSRFRDVTLQNAVVNAMYAATVESELPPEIVFAQLGAQQKPADALASYSKGYLAQIAQYAKSAKGLQMNGIKIPHLYPGTKFNMKPAGTPGGVGQEFEASLLRHLAAILGVSYEQLSRDYTKTNYSSARAASVEAWKFMQSRKRFVADTFASNVLHLWFEEAINTGYLETMKYSKVPNFYDPLIAEALLMCDWIGAARGQIDELKETQAAALRIKYNLSTLEDEMALRGKDWRKVIQQREVEQQELESRGLVMEVDDNMMNAASGSPREQRSDGTEGPNDGERS